LWSPNLEQRVTGLARLMRISAAPRHAHDARLTVLISDALHASVFAHITPRGDSAAVLVREAFDAGFARQVATGSGGRTGVVRNASYAQVAFGIAEWRRRRAGAVGVAVAARHAVIAVAIARVARGAAVGGGKALHAFAQRLRAVRERMRAMRVLQANHATARVGVAVGAAGAGTIALR